jgi:acetyl esterase
MQIDPQVAAYLATLAASGAPPLTELSPQRVRENFAASIDPLFGPLDPVASIEDVQTGRGLKLRLYRPRHTPDPSPAFVYLHGGGWVVGSIETHDGITRALAARSGCVVVAVEYSLAPEHPFPRGLEDALEATRWVADNAESLALDPARLAVGGDSSGANLAAVVTQQARGSGLELAAQVLIYPVTDHNFETGSYTELATGLGLTRDAMRWYWDHYLGEVDGAIPEASPLRAADLGDLPAALVVTAGYDPLRDEGRAYARRLAEAGVPVEAIEYEGMIHGFLRMPAIIDRADEALTQIAGWLSETLA